VIAWLTPDDPPDNLVCVQVTIPGGEAYSAIFRGALVLLFDPENYEQWGAETPEDVAQAFVDALGGLEVPCP
jgi:hypothetical protein